jgi:hypothetical protein
MPKNAAASDFARPAVSAASTGDTPARGSQPVSPAGNNPRPEGCRLVATSTTIIPDSRGSLAFIRKFLHKIQPNQFYTVLLYNRGTEPQTILFYHTDEVQVPQVPRI